MESPSKIAAQIFAYGSLYPALTELTPNLKFCSFIERMTLQQLPINCFTLIKDGLQTLNITAGHTFPHLQSKLMDIIKYPVPLLQGTSANLCYMHSWLLVGDICTSNDRVCKVPLQTNLKPTHHLLARWQGQVRRCLKTIHAINLFPPKCLPINCFTLTKDGLQPLNITAGGKCRHHLRLPSIVNKVDR